MNTKQRIAELERELAALKAKPHCLLPEPAGQGYCLTASFHFDDVQDALDYSKAVETMLLLRRQPGSSAAKDGDQYVICTRNTGFRIEKWFAVECKTEFISPCFASKQAAQAAIDSIGKDRIIHMFNTLHGVK